MVLARWTLFRVFGIPITLDWSVLALVVYIVFSFGREPFVGLLYAVLLLVSIVLHELGHSVVAQAFGCKVRSITLQLLGGVASIENMPRKAYQEALMAAAGPAVSFLLAAIGFAVVAVYHASDGNSWAIAPLWAQALFFMNICLGVFNLLPVFPMDGGRILRSTLEMFGKTRERATWAARQTARAFAILWCFGFVLNVLSLTPQTPSNLPLILDLVWSFLFDGNWFTLLIAFMVWTASDREYRMALFESLKGFNVDRENDDIVIGDPPYGRD